MLKGLNQLLNNHQAALDQFFLDHGMQTNLLEYGNQTVLAKYFKQCFKHTVTMNLSEVSTFNGWWSNTGFDADHQQFNVEYSNTRSQCTCHCTKGATHDFTIYKSGKVQLLNAAPMDKEIIWVNIVKCDSVSDFAFECMTIKHRGDDKSKPVNVKYLIPFDPYDLDKFIIANK